MALIDDTDINVHLPQDKLSAESAADYLEEVKNDVERVIRGTLAGTVDPTEMATWTTPGATPELIRAIGGRLGAAFIYRLRYSEDSLDDPSYAQLKYNEAMEMLKGIVSGTFVLEEVPDESLGLTTDMFYPNDPDTDSPKFSMSSEF
jgi:hypothetical protein